MSTIGSDLAHAKEGAACTPQWRYNAALVQPTHFLCFWLCCTVIQTVSLALPVDLLSWHGKLIMFGFQLLRLNLRQQASVPYNSRRCLMSGSIQIELASCQQLMTDCREDLRVLSTTKLLTE